MKSFLSFLATFSLIEAIGRHPATAGALMLLGVGGGAVGERLADDADDRSAADSLLQQWQCGGDQ